jgi:hypothetical protein
MTDNAKSGLKASQSRNLVIGSTGYSGADFIPWTAKTVPNIVDYDTVIIDVPSLDEATLKKVSSQTLEDIQKQLVRLLDSKGRLIVITDHRHVDRRPKSYPESVDNYDWCPIEIGISEESGESLVVKDTHFNKYLSNLAKWEYFHFIPNSSLSRALTNYYGDTYDTRYAIPGQPLVTNRYDKIIAGVYKIEVRKERTKSRTYGSSYREYPAEPDYVTGEIILLPRIPFLERKEAVCLVLEELTGSTQSSVPPDWVDTISIPGIVELEDEIFGLLDKITEVRNQVRALEQRKESLDRLKKLVYSSGHDLEAVVAISLERLGAMVLPAKYSEEEFVMVFEGVEYLVEVKGVTKSIALGHLRQLNDYLLKYEEDTKKQCKGILFGNAWRDYPPKERGTKARPEFPDNVIRRSEQWGVALVSSVGFFYALSAYLDGKQDGALILRQIVTTNGCVSWP